MSSWKPFSEAPTIGEFLVYLDGTVSGSRTHVMTRTPAIDYIAGHFAWDVPKPLYFMEFTPCTLPLPEKCCAACGLPQSKHWKVDHHDHEWREPA